MTRQSGQSLTEENLDQSDIQRKGLLSQNVRSVTGFGWRRSDECRSWLSVDLKVLGLFYLLSGRNDFSDGTTLQTSQLP